jgi:TolB-like protein/DNA-binding winged helix-turn-helix (wHTH) protein
MRDAAGKSLAPRDGSSGVDAIGTGTLDAGFQVGEWLANPRNETISRGDETRHLEHKVMQTLLVLAQSAGTVVTRDQFLETVWQGRVVNEEALSRAISLLRAALDDNAHEPRYVQTIPRTGYRLVAPVSVPVGMPLPQPEAAARRSRVLAWAGAALVLVCAVALAAWWLWPIAAEAHYDSVAVLPFVSLDGGDDAYFAAGLTEELGSALARVDGLRVVSASWVREFKAEELRSRAHVSAVTEGTVRRRGERLRISARVVDASSGEQLWADTWERDLQDIFAVQSEIATAIVASLRGTFDTPPSIEPPSRNTSAYRDFLLGRYHIGRRGAVNIHRGIALLEQAVAADAGFVEAQLKLAEGYALLPSYEDRDEDAMLVRAEEILDNLGPKPGAADPTRSLRGFIALRRGQWIEAEEEFTRALDTSATDVDALLWRSVLHAAVGYLDRARIDAEKAISIDPLSPITNYRLASVCSWQGDSDCAARQIALAADLGLDPYASPEPRLVLMIRQRRFAELEQTMRELQTRSGGSTDWIAPWCAALQTREPAAVVRAIDALTRADSEHRLPARLLLGVLLTLGDSDNALAAAHQLVSAGHFPDGIEGIYSPEGAAVRALPGFLELARETRLIAFWDRFGWPEFCTRDVSPPSCH